MQRITNQTYDATNTHLLRTLIGWWIDFVKKRVKETIKLFSSYQFFHPIF